jgi:hypothetical protein
MKVWIGGYRHHWTTQRAEQRWYKWRYDKWDWEVEEENRDLWDHAFETTMGIWRILVCRPVNWIKNKIPRIQYIKIDRYDTWSMDSTLTPIILPMLKKLKAEKHGDPFTDDADVPEHLRSTAAPPKENEWDTDEFHSARWDWIMDEMIWAFEQLNDPDNDDQFRKGEMDILWQAYDKDDNKIGEPQELSAREKIKGVTHYQMVDGPKHTMVTDYEAMKAHHARIANGLRLFGVYFRALWD